MAARARRILDERAKSASVRRLFAFGYRRPAQDNAPGETFYDKHRPAARGPARTAAPRVPPGRADYAALPRGARPSGAAGRAALFPLHPGGGHLVTDGGPGFRRANP